MCLFRRKKKKKVSKQEEDMPVYGSYKYAFKTGVKSPREFYRMRLEYLKNKKMVKKVRRKEKEGKL